MVALQGGFEVDRWYAVLGSSSGKGVSRARHGDARVDKTSILK